MEHAVKVKEDDDCTHDREMLVRDLARVAAGDREALARVWQLTSAKLNALLLHMLRDPVVAEDLLQEVYLTVWRRGAAFDPTRASPITWLVAIARNKAIDRLRAERAKGILEPIDASEMPDPGPSVIERLEQADQHTRLFECLGTLDAKHQNAIRTAFFEGLTYEALAAREGVPVGTMKSWIRRGLLRLRACLDR
jgi:RNA polymerase sigma-70 factor, ECF subfamily